MQLALYAVTRHKRPPHTSTVGAPEPLANPSPVNVSVEFTGAFTSEAPVSVAVTLAAKENMQGRLEPEVDSEVGSRYMLESLVSLLAKSDSRQRAPQLCGEGAVELSGDGDAVGGGTSGDASTGDVELTMALPHSWLPVAESIVLQSASGEAPSEGRLAFERHVHRSPEAAKATAAGEVAVVLQCRAHRSSEKPPGKLRASPGWPR